MHSFVGQALDSFFGISMDYAKESEEFPKRKNLIYLIWNREPDTVEILMDEIPIRLRQNQIVTATYLQALRFPPNTPPLTFFGFNRSFYCIQDHDHEVSCNGILFFGTLEPPIVTLDDSEIYKFNLLFQVFLDEFETRDNIQGDMLQMLLKRLIIKTTRLAKEQLVPKELDNKQIDIIRHFNLLVDSNFRTKKKVVEYADLLNKSPKTLSNLFTMYSNRTPLSVIHERIIQEAKRRLIYTDKTTKEIAHELGYRSVDTFHKMFKKNTKQTSRQFKLGVKTQ